MKAKTMEISFTNDFIATERFENEYEEELREEPEVREEIIRHGLVVNMFLDDVLVGECFGITPYEYAAVIDEGQGYYREDDAITDVSMTDNESVYVWSTTLVPQFRGLGYGKKLREEFARYASSKGYAKLVGHATSKSMVCLAESMGAIFRKSAVHPNWFGTDRTAHFYTQFLPQTKEYNCGPFALAYLLETNGMTYNTTDLEISLLTNSEYGTSPGAIQSFLIRKNIPHACGGKVLKPNSIIDITVDEDGHWITLIKKTEQMGDVWWVFDPWPGEGYKVVDTGYLMSNWHSPRYGLFQGFTLL
jgi:GNAT superfamily N-acetyltransferase